MKKTSAIQASPLFLSYRQKRNYYWLQRLFCPLLMLRDLMLGMETGRGMPRWRLFGILPAISTPYPPP
ncbi:hypothetical protein [Sodalis sp. dw_96]|uniref:hypothetical protein n=1 Tax=Sodalis sp. dw_96 TaxID=2719794 RepID=UPI001BD47CD8|nr:hypothetical protein [Sodalis sp. dw_96]